MHTDTKSHNVNIKVVSGVKIKSKELKKQLQKKDTGLNMATQ
jgi:hypothetical protein